MRREDFYQSSITNYISEVPISIISNSRLLREGLSVLLAEELQFTLVASYTSESDRHEQLQNPENHIVLLDTSIGCENAVNWTQYWCNRKPGARVLMLEMIADPDTILACIEAGACGYTLRGASPADVAQMIELVLQDRAVCSPKITAILFRRLAELKAQVINAGTHASPLTDRETQVIHLMADGLSNQEIAEQLVITVRTVKFHVHNVLEKLNQSNRYEAVSVAINNGWI